MKCKKCGSEDVIIQVVTETKTKPRGFFGWLLWIFLVFLISILISEWVGGIVIVIVLVTYSQTKYVPVAVCQNCCYCSRVEE